MTTCEHARYGQAEAGDDQVIRCRLCPHQCRIPHGGRGRCAVRYNENGRLRSAAWGHPVALAVDPIEKKPLFHFLPGRDVLSLGTLGCNLSCRFCQNDTLSRPQPTQFSEVASASPMPPDAIAELACAKHIPAVAVTYNEPAVWTEYAVDIAGACHARGLRMAAVTNGFFATESRADFFAHMDAANVDLKSIHDDFYRQFCGATLAPVLETLEWIRHHTTCWLEVTTLLIPSLNDSDAELDALTAWVAGHLGADTPLHFSAFHGACEMANHPPTPPDTLLRARTRAHQNGLRYVYLGNLRIPGGADTLCPSCGVPLIQRSGYHTAPPSLTTDGTCPLCSTPCPGVWS